MRRRVVVLVLLVGLIFGSSVPGSKANVVPEEVRVILTCAGPSAAGRVEVFGQLFLAGNPILILTTTITCDPVDRTGVATFPGSFGFLVANFFVDSIPIADCSPFNIISAPAGLRCEIRGPNALDLRVFAVGPG